MSRLILGKIIFFENINKNQNIPFIIQETANKNILGINLNQNISNNAKNRYPNVFLDFSADNFLLFELTSSPDSAHSEELFEIYPTHESRYFSLEETRVPNIVQFLKDVLKIISVESVVISFEDLGEKEVLIVYETDCENLYEILISEYTKNFCTAVEIKIKK